MSQSEDINRYRLSFFNNLEEVSNLDSGSVFEMDVKTIRVVIVSMYLKMIRTLSLTQLEYGTTRELNL
ncbi:hypothetical protein WL90_20650 [Burkholderia cenocepacia]|nr:hypothetical protein A2T82_04110 [Burkholderia cenocepacia]AOK36693.1 hypothetical protein WL90_20650 [Burkholderia cenocepacia]